MQLRDQSSAQPLILLVGDPSFASHAVELVELVGDAEADDLPELLTLPRCLLRAPLRHAFVLGDETWPVMGDTRDVTVRDAQLAAEHAGDALEATP
jgi:hypothetical protein